MHVYAIESPSGLVKIGRSTNPDQRITALSSAGGFEPVSAWYSLPVPNAAAIEKGAHALMADARQIGEWFRCSFEAAVVAICQEIMSDNDIKCDPLTERFAVALRAEMTKQGVTQLALANRSGVAQTAISALLSQSKSPTLRTIEKIAAALGIEPSSLIKSDNPSDPETILSTLSESDRAQAIRMLRAFAASCDQA
jgi:transcriptional regulator with XRE-family HTH domain